MASKTTNPTCTMKHMLQLQDNLHRKESLRIAYNQPNNDPMRLLPGSTSTCSDASLTSKQGKVESILTTMNKLAKGKLNLGAKILESRGSEKLFRRMFSVREGEELLRASKCCLSTTCGFLAGRVFITNDKLAFCSDKPIAEVTSPSGQTLTFHYKVVIPLGKIKRALQRENVKKPSQKYLQVVTADDFEFWFVGFVNCKRTLKCLQRAIYLNP